MNNSQSQNPAPRPEAAKISAAEVASALADADNPLDFIRNNLRAQPSIVVPRAEAVPPAPSPASQAANPQASPAPNETAPTQAPAQPSQTFVADTDFPFDSPSPVPPPTAAPSVPPDQKKDEPAVTVEDDEDGEEIQNPLLREVAGDKKSAKINLKQMRKNYNETKQQLEERNALLEAAQAELQKYKTGEIVPETVQELQERIADLEEFEQLHNFRMSKEYRNKFLNPLNAKSEKARQLATNYNVDPAVLDAAMQQPKGRERNAFLKKHFDDIGALEAKNILDEIESLRTEAQEAELEPGRHLQMLRQESEMNEATQEAERLERIKSNTRGGWLEGLNELRNTGEYPMLSLKEGDENHNKMAKPILEEASKEFGKFIRLLGEKGMKEIPAPVAKILAQRFLLSQLAPLSAASAMAHWKRADEVIKTSERITPFIRPALGGGPVNGAPSNGSAAPGGLTPDKAANLLLQKIGVGSL